MTSTLREVYDGARAGTVATVPMSAVILASDWVGVMDRPAPGEVTEETMEAVGARGARDPLQDALTVAGHFGYGAAVGALYAVLRERLPLSGSPAVQGALYGLGVWAASYQGWVPALGLMPPPERDRPGRPSTMIVAHIVFGASLGRRLARG